MLRDGAQVAQHASAQVPTAQLVREMVGRSVDRLFPEIPPPPSSEVALAVKNLSAPDGSFRGISFEVRAGEVFGLAGIVGAGRTELVRAIAGADPIASGEIAIGGKTLRLHSPADAIRERLVLVPDDRKALGVVLAPTARRSAWCSRIRSPTTSPIATSTASRDAAGSDRRAPPRSPPA